MSKIMVQMNKQPVHDGLHITRWEEEDRRGRKSKKKPKAVPEEKKTEEKSPRSSDENDQPRMSTKIWIALRDRDNPNTKDMQ